MLQLLPRIRHIEKPPAPRVRLTKGGIFVIEGGHFGGICGGSFEDQAGRELKILEFDENLVRFSFCDTDADTVPIERDTFDELVRDKLLNRKCHLTLIK